MGGGGLVFGILLMEILGNGGSAACGVVIVFCAGPRSWFAVLDRCGVVLDYGSVPVLCQPTYSAA